MFGQPPQIGLEGVQVNDQRRCVDIADVVADFCWCRLHAVASDWCEIVPAP